MSPQSLLTSPPARAVSRAGRTYPPPPGFFHRSYQPWKGPRLSISDFVFGHGYRPRPLFGFRSCRCGAMRDKMSDSQRQPSRRAWRGGASPACRSCARKGFRDGACWR